MTTPSCAPLCAPSRSPAAGRPPVSDATVRRLVDGLSCAGSSEGLRVGVDVVCVEDVAVSIGRHGGRYLGRIFTDHELASCRIPAATGGGYRTEALAARFAAKEAALKVLRPSGPRPAWRSIEVRRHPSGWCELQLSGQAAVLAEEAGIGELSVSLSHETHVAAAAVVATSAAQGGTSR